jgi:hypothetical protein
MFLFGFGLWNRLVCRLFFRGGQANFLESANSGSFRRKFLQNTAKLSLKNVLKVVCFKRFFILYKFELEHYLDIC